MNAVTTLEHVVEIDAAPATVFDFWTTTDGLCSWWAESAEVDARPGGAIRVDIDGEHVMVGEFVALDPPHDLRFTFGWEGGDPGPSSTEVHVRLEPLGRGTRLTLRHHGLLVEHVESHARGWEHFLGVRIVETGART